MIRFSDSGYPTFQEAPNPHRQPVYPEIQASGRSGRGDGKTLTSFFRVRDQKAAAPIMAIDMGFDSPKGSSVTCFLFFFLGFLAFLVGVSVVDFSVPSLFCFMSEIPAGPSPPNRHSVSELGAGG